MNNQHTLDQLIHGQLTGCRELRLTHLGLTAFPIQILKLADTLELLDLSGNLLTQLPNEIAQLQKLKIAFFSENKFEIFPEVLGSLPLLEMIGFKANFIHSISEDALPQRLRWLILTQNKLSHLPKSIGNKTRLQKLMLAGNKLTALPYEMQLCTNLELLRISANQFTALPPWIWSLPKLSWLAYAGNPMQQLDTKPHNTDSFHWDNFEILHHLGEGASGIISKAKNKTTQEAVALKIFKGDVTSDGWPYCEMQACIHAGTHPNLIPILGNIAAHPSGKDGLVMKLLPETYRNLGLPPNFDTCTRDVYPTNTSFDTSTLLKIVSQIADCCMHLHEKGIAHGDIYAHNILLSPTYETILGDFGAATWSTETNAEHERLEVRAWACLLEDLLPLVQITTDNDKNTVAILTLILQKCIADQPQLRPDFREIAIWLNKLAQ